MLWSWLIVLLYLAQELETPHHHSSPCRRGALYPFAPFLEAGKMALPVAAGLAVAAASCELALAQAVAQTSLAWRVPLRDGAALCERPY